MRALARERSRFTNGRRRVSSAPELQGKVLQDVRGKYALSTTAAVAGVCEGDLLAGKYRVERVLGVGGMGVVVAAHHVELDDRVAIKFLLPEALKDSQAVARFAREGRAAVKIRSEHVAKVTDVGKLESGAPYMVMEYLEGRDLATWLRERGAFPIEQAIDFVLQACEAIAEAHVLGLVHRDLKPANLFVTRRADGTFCVKVLDFGISKVTLPLGPDGSGSMTSTSALIGSPLYMSPEQMQCSRDVDLRTDIWALGVILYQFVTGLPPFTADTMAELVLRVVQGSRPAAIQRLRPDAPDGLEEVILRCLERDRAARYANVGELAFALSAFASKQSRSSVERILGVVRTAGFSSTATAFPSSSDGAAMPGPAGTGASWGKTLAPGRRRGLWALGVAVFVGLGGIFGWRLRNRSAVAVPAAMVAGGKAEVAVSLAPARTTGPVTSQALAAGVPPKESALEVAASAPAAPVVADRPSSAAPSAPSAAAVVLNASEVSTRKAPAPTAAAVPPPSRAASQAQSPRRRTSSPATSPSDANSSVFDERK